MDLADRLLIAFGILVFCIVIFLTVLSACGLLPDNQVLLVVDGVEYHDVRDITVTSEIIVFGCNVEYLEFVTYEIKYTDYEIIKLKKGFFQKEFVEVQ